MARQGEYVGWSKPKQNWEIGRTVRVGFLQLEIVGREELEDREDVFEPRAWFLRSAKGEAYTFTPHHGLNRI